MTDLWFAIFRNSAAGTSIVSHIDTEANIDKHIQRMLAGGFCTLVRKMRVDELPPEPEGNDEIRIIDDPIRETETLSNGPAIRAELQSWMKKTGLSGEEA